MCLQKLEFGSLRWTPLHYAVGTRNAAIVKAFMKKLKQLTGDDTKTMVQVLNAKDKVSVNASERGVYGNSEVQQRNHTGHGCDVWFCAEFS